jgi:hypothetical protein
MLCVVWICGGVVCVSGVIGGGLVVGVGGLIGGVFCVWFVVVWWVVVVERRWED